MNILTDLSLSRSSGPKSWGITFVAISRLPNWNGKPKFPWKMNCWVPPKLWRPLVGRWFSGFQVGWIFRVQPLIFPGCQPASSGEFCFDPTGGLRFTWSCMPSKLFCDGFGGEVFCINWPEVMDTTFVTITLQGTNISHLWEKENHLQKCIFGEDMLVPRRQE